MKTLFETPNFIISYDLPNGWLHLLWQGHHNEADSKNYCLIVLEKVRLTGATLILNDALLDKDGWGELTRWIAQSFMRQLSEDGIKAVAWVLPENIKALIAVHTVVAQVSCPLIETFTDIEDAYHWLKKGTIIPNPDC